MQLQYKAQMPEESGEYLFVLTDGRTIYGYYASFPYPYDRHVKYYNYVDEQLSYLPESEIKGHYKIY